MIILWLPRAIRDRDTQIDYIAEHNLSAAIDQGDRIHKQVAMLATNSGLGRPGRLGKTRELVIGGTPFIIVYREKQRASRVEIIRLLHGAQQWPPMSK